MQQILSEEIIKIQSKGVITIPKDLRDQLGLKENAFARIKKEKGRLIIEPVRILPYSVRSYTEREIDEFLKEDRKDSNQLKKK